MDIRKCLWLFLLCFLSAPSLPAQRNYIDIPNYILCINSYVESAPWSSRMISTISEYVQKDSQLAMYAEHMNTLMTDNDSILEDFKNMISQKYSQPRPRLLVLLGSPAFTLRDEYRKFWGDIPVILCSEEDFLGPQKSYFRKQAIAPADRIPMSQFADPYNMVFLYSNLYLRENVQLINHINPNLKKFIFIGDEREINLSNNLDIEDEL